MWPRVVQWWRQIGSTRRLTQALLWESQETNRLLRELIERQTGFVPVAARAQVALHGRLVGTPTPAGLAWNQRTGLPLPPEAPSAVDSPPASPPTPSATPRINETS